MEESVVACGPYSVKVSSHEGTIHHVVLPLSPAQWVDVASKTGESLSTCCASISAIRDLLVSALREGGTMNADDLRELVELLREHDGYEEFRAADLATWEGQAASIASTNPDWPFLPIGYVWYCLREQLREPHIPEPAREDPRNVEDAVWILWRAGSSMIDTFLGGSDGDTVAHRAQKLRALHKMIPAVKTLHDRLAEIAPAPFEAFALVRRETGDVVGTGAPFVFETVEQLLHRAGWWRNLAERRAMFAVHRCKVSLEKGLEVGEEVPVPNEPPPAE